MCPSRRYQVISLSAAATGLLLFVSGCRKPAEEAPIPVVAVQAQHPVWGPIAEEITADAILAPLAQAALAPRISAPIRAIYVQRGAHVNKGQLLASLEAGDLEGAALDSKGGLISAQAAFTASTLASIPESVQKAQLDVSQARANLDVANRLAEERKRLLQQGAIAGRDVDTAVAADVQAQAAYDMAVKHLDSVRQTTQVSDTKSAEGLLASAKGRYQGAQAQVGYATLLSPISGVVTERPLFAGETAAAGSAVVTIMDTSSLLAKLHISQASAQKLQVGGAAQVYVPGVDEPVAATVSLISPVTDAGSTTIEVWLKLANADGRFKVGTPVRAVIQGVRVGKALLIPPTALQPQQGTTESVMLAGSDGMAHRKVVTPGIRTTDNVQIVHGLSAADMVITEGAYGLDESTRITVGEKKSDTREDQQ